MDKLALRVMFGNRSGVEGVVSISISFKEYQVLEPFPFAFVEDDMIPCCLLVGVNFLKKFKAKLRLKDNRLLLLEEEFIFNVNMNYIRLMTLESAYENDMQSKPDTNRKLRFQIATEDLILMQDSTHIIANLRDVVRARIPTKHWRVPALSQFKRYVSDLTMRDGMLMRMKDHFG